MNRDYNFEEEFKKFVRLSADYGMSLDYARNKYHYADLLFSWDVELSQRKNNYVTLIPLIEQLKEKFKELVIIDNNLASFQGFPNRLELYLTKNGIPREKYNYFLENVDHFVEIVHSDFPMTEEIQKLEEKGIREWNEFIAPHSEGYIGFLMPFNSHNDVVNAVAEDLTFKKNRERIRIVERVNKPFSKTIYVPNEDVVEIQIDKNAKYGTHSSLRFVFLLGFALAMLKHADRGEDANHLPVYLLAYEADKFTFNFVRTQMTERAQKYFRYNLLRTITFALFAIDIYTNDQQDFDVAFAKAVNRCYLKARQEKNPFYVFKEPINLIQDLMESISYVELYLEEGKTKHSGKNN